MEHTHLIDPEIGMKVYKYGSTTGITFGVITSVVSALKVNNENGDKLEFQNQISIEGRDEHFIEPRNFSKGGDSGSVIFDIVTNKVVGLHFCGNGINRSYANNAVGVFENLRIKLR